MALFFCKEMLPQKEIDRAGPAECCSCHGRPKLSLVLCLSACSCPMPLAKWVLSSLCPGDFTVLGQGHRLALGCCPINVGYLSLGSMGPSVAEVGMVIFQTWWLKSRLLPLWYITGLHKFWFPSLEDGDPIISASGIQGAHLPQCVSGLWILSAQDLIQSYSGAHLQFSSPTLPSSSPLGSCRLSVPHGSKADCP